MCSTEKNFIHVFPRKLPGSIILWIWLKKELVSWLKEPAAVFLNMAYPELMMLFAFMAAGDSLRKNEDAASLTVAMLAMIGALMVGINLPSNGITGIRGTEYYRYTRTLPCSIGARLTGWLGAPIILGYLSAMIALALGSAVSAARFSLSDIAFMSLLVVAFLIPCSLIGLSMGFLLSKKTSLAVSLAVSFALLLMGGGEALDKLPPFLKAIENILPTTSAYNLTVQYFQGGSSLVHYWLILLLWAAIFFVLSFVAISRDEKRSFS